MNNGYWTLWKCLLGRIFKPEDFFFKKIKIWCCRVTSRGPKKRSASEGWLRDRLGQIDSFESLDGQWGLMVLSSFLDSSFQWPPSCAPSGEEVRAVGKGLELGKSCDLKWTAYTSVQAGWVWVCYKRKLNFEFSLNLPYPFQGNVSAQSCLVFSVPQV